MEPGRIALLEDRGVVAVSGPHARGFLQDLITTNMDRVDETGAGFGALLSPQGKILFDFLVLRDGERYLFDVARPLASDLAIKLGFYRLRARVAVVDFSVDLQVAAAWRGTAAPRLPGVVAADPRLPALGWRAIVPAGTRLPPPGYEPVPAIAYHMHRIRLGVPEGGADFAFGDAFPHDADMDDLNGLDFRKGCYVGQEVVSRMEHRGTARRRLIQVTGQALPPAGTPVLAAERPLGTLGSSAGGAGLALLRLDKAKAALDAGTPITAGGGAALAIAIPAWARFGWPAGGDEAEAAPDPAKGPTDAAASG
jgi:folate-binding protein YgfZ